MEDPWIWPGVLVIGQEQDLVGAAFNVYQAFSGKLSEVNMWSRVLPDDTIRALAWKSDNLQGDIVSWRRSLWDLSGVEITNDVSGVGPLNADETFLNGKFILAETTNYDDFSSLCRVMRGRLPEPRNMQETFNLGLGMISGLRAINASYGQSCRGSVGLFQMLVGQVRTNQIDVEQS